MEHRLGARHQQLPYGFAIGYIAGREPEPLVIGQGQGRWRIVEQYQLVDGAEAAAPLQQQQRQPPTRETRSRR